MKSFVPEKIWRPKMGETMIKASLSHVKWDCKYHLVFVTKYRPRSIYGTVKKNGCIIRDLCRQKSLDLHEGHADFYMGHLKTFPDR